MNMIYIRWNTIDMIITMSERDTVVALDAATDPESPVGMVLSVTPIVLRSDVSLSERPLNRELHCLLAQC